MVCTYLTSRNNLKFLIVILIVVCAVAVIFSFKEPKSNEYFRIEDLSIFDGQYSVLSTAFTSEYKLSVVDYYPPDMAGRMAWEPSAHRLALTDVATGEEKILERIDSWFIFVLSDGDTFYLFVDKHKDETEYSEPYIHMVYSFDPKTETLEHLITYGPTDQSDDIGAFPMDIVANGKQIYFIYKHSIQVFDAEKKTCEVLYTTEDTLANSFTSNRAKLYHNELFVVTNDGVLFSIDVLTGEETGRRIHYVGTNTKLSETARSDDFNNLYWVWGDELVYQDRSIETMVAYDLVTGECRTLYHGIFTILFADDEGLYVNISDAGSNLFYFKPAKQTFEYLGAQKNLPEKLMTDWVYENTYGKAKKWFHRDFLATPGEA